MHSGYNFCRGIFSEKCMIFSALVTK